ncbi:4-hydroxy-3-methylbut-2-enyl diphosphate reductase [Konateibacter massiliensis]|uniref:4-hydroxy-3-methylbut-2-enyl diphosphate reductase n=1 Tax=Konateibacter massiliensis TaxID=2002841 RepID=UPI000C14EE6A|nr:4-hydroxy-3-methylbut-2-enyl diphosphate reductase [Konateibacter massiliensis]
MEVVLAKTAGFCFGVKRAVDTVYEHVDKGSIYTYGPIIHNEEVVKDLEKKGVKVINTEEELKAVKDGTVIIRSHGTAKKIYDILEENNIDYVDATCPYVKKIHKIVNKRGSEGYEIVIIGNTKHPEVEGIKGWCSSKVTVIENAEQAENYTAEEKQKVCIVSQTTFNYNKFKDLVEIISKKGYDIIVLNTICSATEERQAEASRVASQVEAMIVIGDKHSSNTQKLYEICNEECENTYYIQTLDDLDTQSLQFFGSVGITAGASTPNNIIEEVHSNVRNEF